MQAGSPHSAPRSQTNEGGIDAATLGSEALLGEHPDTSAAALGSCCHALVNDLAQIS
jgi:hypothetical protein